MTFHGLLARGLIAAALSSPVAAVTARAAGALPTSPKGLVATPAGTSDLNFEVVGTSDGFLLVWDRFDAAFKTTVFAQRFDKSGKPIGAATSPEGPDYIGQARPEIVALGGDKFGVVWRGNANKLKGAVIDGATGKFGAVQVIVADKNSNLIHDIAALDGGKVALVTRTLPDFMTENTTVAILDSDMKPRGEPKVVETDVPTAGFMDSYEQTVVSTGAGGVALFRTSDGALDGRVFDGAGKPGKTFQVNTTPMGSLFASTLIDFNVKAEPLPGGGYVVVWTSLDEGSSLLFNIRVRIYNAKGKPVGNDFLANQDLAGHQVAPEILVLDKGFGVAFTSRGPQGQFKHVVRYFDLTGAPLSDDLATEYFGAYTRSGIVLPDANTEYARLPGGGFVKVFGGQIYQNIYSDGVPGPTIGKDGGDEFSGKSGDEIVLGRDGKDALGGDSGDDALDGGPGADTLDGGPGDDVIVSGEGDDSMSGGKGADVFAFRPGGGSDTVLDFDAEDRIDVTALHYPNVGVALADCQQAGRDLLCAFSDHANPDAGKNEVRFRRKTIADLPPTAVIQ